MRYSQVSDEEKGRAGLSDISRDEFIRAIECQAAVADAVEKGRPDDTPEFRKTLKSGAEVMRRAIRDLCNDLDVDVPGVNVPEVCIDCGGEDGDHASDCPADKLAAMDKRL